MFRRGGGQFMHCVWPEQLHTVLHGLPGAEKPNMAS